MKIGTRLGAAFTVVLALALALVAVGIIRLQQVAEAAAQMDVANAKADLADEWLSSNMINNARTQARLRAADAADAKAIITQMAATSAVVSKAQRQLESMVQSEQGKALMAEIGSRRKVYNEWRSKVLAASVPGVAPSAELIDLVDNKMMPASAAYDDAVRALSGHQRDMAHGARAGLDQAVASGKLLLLAVGALALAAGALLAWSLTRSITRPLRQAVEVARTVAAGDLTARVEVASNDETGQLMAALKTMNANLNRLVAQVRGGADTIATAAIEVAAGNQDLSSRTEQQAGALEETASSMEELTGTVQQNAENARQGNALAASASNIAARGGAVVGQVVETMNAIHGSASKIVDIIAVIDGIAFQTNILALNAAVEAARAGEQGRGFAVVASEVRSLAQRSATAAKEIKALIDDSVEKVDAGTKLVGEAGATMTEVVDSVRRVSGIMGEIAAASQEQGAGIEQVNQAIGQMDTVTQQNAALVEEAAAATEAMQEQARSLLDVVSVFKLDGAHAAASAAPAVPRQPQPAAPASRRAPAAATARPAQLAAGDWEAF